MKKYRVSKWRVDIEEIEVARETEKFVFINHGEVERREGKDTDWIKIFDSWDLARDYLVRRTQEKIESLQEQIRKNGNDLARIVAMTKP